jgi:hypothetical protein
MNTTEGIWVPTYYQQRRRFSWLRTAGRPQVTDWIAGAALAVLVMALITFAHTPQHQEVPPTQVAANQ